MAACIAACGHHAHADEEGNHDHETEEAGHEGHGQADQDHGAEIILEPEKARAAGVKVETVKPANFHVVIHPRAKVMAASTVCCVRILSWSVPSVTLPWPRDCFRTRLSA